jgi:hypothetical protein
MTTMWLLLKGCPVILLRTAAGFENGHLNRMPE